MTSHRSIALLALFFLACGGDDDDRAPDAALVDSGTDAGPLPEPAADYFVAGPHVVASTRVTLVDDAREGRALPVEIWYPAVESARDAAAAGHAMAEFETGTRATELARLVSEAPPACLRARTRSARDAEPLADTARWPFVVFSHCHVCTRFDVAEVSERLASFGIAVVAPDHEGNTLWDELEGDAAPVGAEFLEVRVADVRFVLDAMLEDTNDALPDALRGRFDAARAGVMGHSFGAATAGVAAARDPRFVAAMAIAAPITALGGGVRAADVSTPFLFLLAREDNSITEVGNRLIRGDHSRLSGPSWLVEVDDAGHWSFSDHCGLIDLFDAGCGTGTRQTMSGVEFNYLDNSTARDIAADVAASFFARWLLGDEGATTLLARQHDSGAVTVSARVP
ncbi:putative lipase (putative secreted protein) [Sandaracinus amylolyticus]|uniref:Putative lipase (Putative secreted protein) n=1 Tax=Sandaracinus amylolyticus TaxID=927083 RepID=A0A0F6YM52_9BACT|nr:putative lipase (putative secreted protein) [Sandaracinus amylolyticus]